MSAVEEKPRIRGDRGIPLQPVEPEPIAAEPEAPEIAAS